MNKGKQSASRKQASAVVALGRKCAKMAYPNPQRQGCPDPSKLRAMAYRDRGPNFTDLPISHVVRCSPCFSQYLRLRRRLILATIAQLTAACLALFFVVFASLKLVRQNAATSVQPNVAETEHQSPTPATGQVPLAGARLAIEVNLQSLSPLRGDAPQNAPNKIHLPANNLRITVILPIGMEPGLYTVRLLDARRTHVLQKPVTASIAGGAASFVIDVDLAKTAAQTELTMMIRAPGLSWRKYPIVVD